MSSITDSILGTNNSPSLEMPELPDLPELTEMSSLPEYMSPDDSYFSTTTWLLLILLLGFVGFNIYLYLAKESGTSFTDTLVSLKTNITNLFPSTEPTPITTVPEPEEINESPIPLTSDTKITTHEVKTAFPQGDVAQANALNKAINTSTSQKQQVNGEDYQADDSSSSIQKGASKAGFCYIGEDRGFRTCEEVGVNDTCMSGNIFPTRDICVNPKLRA